MSRSLVRIKGNCKKSGASVIGQASVSMENVARTLEGIKYVGLEARGVEVWLLTQVSMHTL